MCRSATWPAAARSMPRRSTSSRCTTRWSRPGPTPGVPPSSPSLWQTEPLVRIGDADSLLTSAADPVVDHDAGGTPPGLAAPGHRPRQRDVAPRRGRRPHFGDRWPALLSRATIPSRRRRLRPCSQLSDHALYPGTARVVIADDVRGVPVTGLLRRIALAWALQERDAARRAPAPDVAVDWARAPQLRLATLAPYAEWSAAVPAARRWRDCYWISNGYIADEHFPLSTRASLGGRRIGHAARGVRRRGGCGGGDIRIFMRADAGPVADAWATLAAGVVEPWTPCPPPPASMLPYPAELFLVQSRVLENAETGTLAGRADSLRHHAPRLQLLLDAGRLMRRRAPPSTCAAPAASCRPCSSGPASTADCRSRQVEVDSAVALPGPAALEQRWERFPTFVQVLDSVRAGGGVLTAGGVRYWVHRRGSRRDAGRATVRAAVAGPR